MNRPTVLLCSDYLPPSDGGVENVIDESTRHLAGDVSFHVFSLDSPDRREVNLAKDVEVHVATNVNLRRFIGVQSKVSVSAVAELYRLLRDVEPDVLHLHNRFFFSTAVGYLVGRATRFKGEVITTVHLGDVSGVTGLAGKIARLYERTLSRRIIRGSDRIVAVSDAAAKHAISLGANEARTYVLPNGVDTDVFQPAAEPPAEPSILFVGRLVKNKGPEDLMEALPAVFERHPEASATFVGTGPLRERLETRAIDLGVDRQVKFRGRVPDVSVMMRNASVFCRPSRTEGLPLTLLEAMATGIPPVVTPIAGVPEVVNDGKTGILVPPGDQETLSNALATLLDQPDMATVIGEHARKHVVKHHSWERRAEQLLELYRPGNRPTVNSKITNEDASNGNR